MDVHGFIHDLDCGDIPAEVMHMARRCLADTCGIWAAGIATPVSRITRDHAARRYPGDLAMPFDGRCANPVGFAFAGGATIDAIDGHDGHQLTKGHASVALVPALLAEMGMTPRDTLDQMLAHLIVGAEIAIRAGMSLHASVPDYHSSGAWNGIGAAAIGARLRRLNTDQTRHALGIAEYYGPRAQMMRCIDHPTMVKDSSSWGAMVGVSALDLAQDGFTGAPAITLDSDIFADLGQRWRILETNFKAYPVCRWAQPAIEGVLSLMRDHGLQSQLVTGITVTTFHEATRLNTRRPADGDAAQYSLPLAVALALAHGDVLPRHLLPETFNQPEVWRLVDLITCAESTAYNAAFPAQRFADVAVTLADGRVLQSQRASARGNHDNPLSDAELDQKLRLYAGDVLPAASVEALAGLLDGDRPEPAALIALLQPVVA